MGNPRLSAAQTILVGDIPIEVTRKRIKHLHLRVHAPDGRVRVSAPHSVRLRAVQSFVSTRLEWIRRHRDRIQNQVRVPAARFVDDECHSVWGRPYLLTVVERDSRQGVSIADGRLTLVVRPGSDLSGRLRVMQRWHKSMLNEAVPPLIEKWEQRLNVKVNAYSLRQMKTRWGTCNPRTKHIRLNTELATQPAHLLEYLVVHEMVHLHVPNHGASFVALMNRHYPEWRKSQAELRESGEVAWKRRRHPTGWRTEDVRRSTER